MRVLYLGLALAGVMLMAQPVAAAQPLATCAPAQTPLDKLICVHPDLREADKRIADRIEQLRLHYQGEDRRVFDVEYKRWRYRLNSCASPGGDPWNKRGAYGCVRDDFDARFKFLAGLASGKDIQEVAASYRQVDPWYVNELPKQYEGRAVDVFAEIHLRNCGKPDMPHSVLLRTSRSLIRDGYIPAERATIEFRFGSMQDYVKDRLCEKQPLTSWTGTVMLDRGKPYLYVPELYW